MKLELRDYFAGLAMQAIVQAKATIGSSDVPGALTHRRIAKADISQISYEWADSMIKARGK